MKQKLLRKMTYPLAGLIVAGEIFAAFHPKETINLIRLVKNNAVDVIEGIRAGALDAPLDIVPNSANQDEYKTPQSYNMEAYQI